MDNNLSPYSIATGWENIYYLTPYFKFIKKKIFEDIDIDKLFDYHNISNCQIVKNYEYIKFIQILIIIIFFYF